MLKISSITPAGSLAFHYYSQYEKISLTSCLLLALIVNYFLSSLLLSLSFSYINTILLLVGQILLSGWIFIYLIPNILESFIVQYINSRLTRKL